MENAWSPRSIHPSCMAHHPSSITASTAVASRLSPQDVTEPIADHAPTAGRGGGMSLSSTGTGTPAGRARHKHARSDPSQQSTIADPTRFSRDCLYFCCSPACPAKPGPGVGGFVVGDIVSTCMTTVPWGRNELEPCAKGRKQRAPGMARSTVV